MEIWKKIKGYDFYEVSNTGKVRSLDKTIMYETKNKTVSNFVKGRDLKQNTDRGGYQMVYLSEKSKVTTYKVHRLVMIAFTDIDGINLDVNHINGIKDDNRLENLEWATRKHNILHAYETNLVGEKRKISKEQAAEIVCKYLPYKYTLKKLAREYGVSEQLVLNIVNGVYFK